MGTKRQARVRPAKLLSNFAEDLTVTLRSALDIDSGVGSAPGIRQVHPRGRFTSPPRFTIPRTPFDYCVHTEGELLGHRAAMKSSILWTILCLSCCFAFDTVEPVIAAVGRLPTLTIRRLTQARWSSIALRVTAYVVDIGARGCPRNPGRTATGEIARFGTVAVDTHRFPFGTRFFIPGYGFGTASDTGGHIRGQHIDIAMRSCARAIAWGSRVVTVSYLPVAHS